ncbi:hypothetical protein QOT17_002987 [Balamuthia mandrillaris]
MAGMEEQAGLEAFIDVTGAERQTALFYLKAAAGNVEVALSNFFDGVPTETTSSTPTTVASEAEAPPTQKSGEQILATVCSEVDNIDRKKQQLTESKHCMEDKEVHKQCLSLSEELMRKLEALDALRGGEELRAERKQLVLRIQNMLGEVDLVRQACAL